MKRCWFGGGLLLLLLLAGLWLSIDMGNYHRELGADLARTAGLDRDRAQEAVEQAREAWNRRRFLAAVVSDHAPLEQIEENFRLLTPETREEEFREICLRLSAQLEALGEAQLPTLENLF